MTKKEVKEYLYKYCKLYNVCEEKCTLENVLKLIPNVNNIKQKKRFEFHAPLHEHQFDNLIYPKSLRGELTLMRDDDGRWSCDWVSDGIMGTLPQGDDLMTASLYMCEFCVINDIPLCDSEIQYRD